MNICGCLVHISKEKLDLAKEDIAKTEGAEIYGENEDGRLVVVVEDTRERFASDIIMGLHQIPGVISLTLTYHHFEPDQSTSTQNLIN